MTLKNVRKARYPENWEDLCALVINRAGNRCEGSPRYPDCHAQNGERHPTTGAVVVLTVAHLHENDTMTQDISRLAAQCQCCHLSRDEKMHERHRRQTLGLASQNPFDRETQCDQWYEWRQTRAYQTVNAFDADLAPGWWVALVTVDLRGGCLVGQVQDVTKRGVRLTLVDWIVGRAAGNDFFIPWGQIAFAFVATPGMDTECFAEDAKRYQERFSASRYTPAPAPPTGTPPVLPFVAYKELAQRERDGREQRETEADA